MSLVVHPTVEKLKKQLSDLIFEYEDLINQVCPNIERNYVVRFGFLEYTLYKRDFERDKLKMKLRLIQSEINNQNDVDVERIDAILEEKFRDYEKNLKQSLDELNEKLGEKGNLTQLSEEDSQKIKQTYKKLVKMLHPDLNDNQTDFEKELFIKATIAYKYGNLNELESILMILPTEELNHESDIDKMELLIEEFKDKIDKIKNEYPYNKKQFVSDETKAKEYTDLLNELIESRNKEIDSLNEKINQLI